MNKTVYIVRHCEATGQPPEFPLTEAGFEQASGLMEFFLDKRIERIISSPFLRAIQTVKPLSEKKDLMIELDERLSERILSTTNLPDWYEKLKVTFDDLELKFEGGESSQEAMNRIVEVVEEVLKDEVEHTLIVTHGNIMSLLLKNYQSEINFSDWENLSNPDVYQLSFTNSEIHIERIWRGLNDY